MAYYSLLSPYNAKDPAGLQHKAPACHAQCARWQVVSRLLLPKPHIHEHDTRCNNHSYAEDACSLTPQLNQTHNQAVTYFFLIFLIALNRINAAAAADAASPPAHAAAPGAASEHLQALLLQKPPCRQLQSHLQMLASPHPLSLAPCSQTWVPYCRLQQALDATPGPGRLLQQLLCHLHYHSERCAPPWQQSCRLLLPGLLRRQSLAGCLLLPGCRQLLRLAGLLWLL